MITTFRIHPELEAYINGQSVLASDNAIEGILASKKKGIVIVDVFESREDSRYFEYKKTLMPLNIVEFCARGIIKSALPDTLTMFSEEYPDMEWKTINQGPKTHREKPSLEEEPEYEPVVQDQHGQSYVYFLQGGDSGLIKIGKANDVNKRIADIQRMSPVVLNILCAIKCKDAHKLESELHNRFMKYRRHGEWFEPTKGIYDFIAEVKS